MKIKNILLLILVLLTLVGCDNPNDSVICDKLGDVNLTINDSGDAFLSNNKFYYIGSSRSNSNCHILDQSNEFVKVFNDGSNSFLIDSMNHIYTLEKNDNYRLSDIFKSNISIEAIVDFARNEKYVKAILINDEKYIVLKSDGKIYEYNVVFSNYNYSITGEKVVLEFEDEKILDFNSNTYDIFDYNYEFLWVKTDKSFYTSYVSNYEECNNDINISCKHDIHSSSLLTNNYENISIVYNCNYNKNEEYINCDYITKDGNIYESRNTK